MPSKTFWRKCLCPSPLPCTSTSRVIAGNLILSDTHQSTFGLRRRYVVDKWSHKQLIWCLFYGVWTDPYQEKSRRHGNNADSSGRTSANTRSWCAWYSSALSLCTCIWIYIIRCCLAAFVEDHQWKEKTKYYRQSKGSTVPTLFTSKWCCFQCKQKIKEDINSKCVIYLYLYLLMRALNLPRKTTVRSVTVIARPNWTQLALWTVDVRPVTCHHLYHWSYLYIHGGNIGTFNWCWNIFCAVLLLLL